MKLSQLYLSGTEISCFSMSKTPFYLEQLIRIARGKLNAEKKKQIQINELSPGKWVVTRAQELERTLAPENQAPNSYFNHNQFSTFKIKLLVYF